MGPKDNIMDRHSATNKRNRQTVRQTQRYSVKLTHFTKWELIKRILMAWMKNVHRINNWQQLAGWATASGGLSAWQEAASKRSKKYYKRLFNVKVVQQIPKWIRIIIQSMFFVWWLSLLVVQHYVVSLWSTLYYYELNMTFACFPKNIYLNKITLVKWKTVGITLNVSSCMMSQFGRFV